MALRALRDHAVDAMTGGTVKQGMLALILLQELALQHVAVETGIFALEGDVQGRVGVLVAVEAACKLEMGLSRLLMALTAGLDRLLHFRRMTRVTSDTWHVSVSFPGRGYFFHPGGMTLHAFFFFILRFYLCRRSA
jgi:hypothetical protein